MQTYGEYLVGSTFNPSGNEKVDQIKKMAAYLINEIEDIKYSDTPDESARCASIAITNIEQGVMWAVKAATKPLRG